MNRLTWIFLYSLIAHTGSAQNITGPIGAKSWMLGGCSASVDDIWSVNNNPAASTGIQNIQGGIYSEQRFNEASLKLISAGLLMPAKHVHIGAAVNYYGYTAFNQQKLAVSLGKSLNSMISIGIQLNYVSTFIEDNGQAGNTAIAAGVYIKPISKLRMGFMIFNPTQNSYGKYTQEKIPSYGRLGCAYSVSDKITLHAEADQWLNRQLVWRGGVYYKIHDMFHLAMGAVTQPTYYTFGTALVMKRIKLDMATSFHEVLGLTPHIGISLPVKK